METNEVMVNEEVLEAVEDIVEVRSGKGMKTFWVVGGVALLCGLTYKYVIEPRSKKKKSKKEQLKDAEIVDGNVVNITDCEDEESEEE